MEWKLGKGGNALLWALMNDGKLAEELRQEELNRVMTKQVERIHIWEVKDAKQEREAG